ncbi:MAG TPA: DinB family protein [Ktedonobacteraceae bacterium]|nr:DinB family protein [Ktedonobacteraceae bacterium]
MNSDIITLNAEQETLLAQLAESRARVLSLVQEGKLDLTRLYQLANTEMHLSLSLHFMPIEPGEHVHAAHTYAHRYLEHLTRHDPKNIVVADETHSYTPRKILRRVLDHALDHQNQIEQWLIWQQHDIAPTPTDGWATSEETFQEDLQLLSSSELQAWLWRIDLTVGMVVQRAKQLTVAQLDWLPPDGGWPLRRTLYHLAFAEIFYSVWLDEPLPEEAVARYREARSRFEQQLRHVFLHPAEKSMALFSPESHTAVTAEYLVQLVLAEEQTLLRSMSDPD